MCPAKKKSASNKNGNAFLPAESDAYAGWDEARRERFADAVRKIEQKFGYTVAAIPAPRENPYAKITAEQSLKIAIEVGIVTKSGKLGKRYR